MIEIVATFLRFAHVYDDAGSGPPASPEARGLARETAVESMVLLRNEDRFLPRPVAEVERVAVVGRLADRPNLGDGGSSDVLQPEVVTALDGIVATYPAAEVTHSTDDASVVADADLVVVVVGYGAEEEGEFIGADATAGMTEHMPPPDHPVAGFPPGYEAPAMAEDGGDQGGGQGFAEGGDRDSLRLRPDDEALIDAVAAVSDRVVVVDHRRRCGGHAMGGPGVGDPDGLVPGYAGRRSDRCGAVRRRRARRPPSLRRPDGRGRPASVRQGRHRP